MDYRDFLKTIEHFKDLDDREIRLLNDVCRLETHVAGSIVIAEGTRRDNFYIIQNGSVSVYKRFHHSDSSLLAELGAGDLFGELSFIDDEPRSATVVTNVASRLLAEHKEDFKRLMEDNPLIGTWYDKRWMEMLGRRFGATTLSRQQPYWQIYSDFRFDVTMVLPGGKE